MDDWLAAEGIEIPVLGCHAHFLKDIGTDLLDPSHAALRTGFRNLKVRPRLRSLARDLGRKLGRAVDSTRQDVRAWLEGTVQNRSLPKGRAAGIGAVRAVAQWVLDYQADSSGEDFPFDRAYLDLYNRCTLALRAVEGFLGELPSDKGVLKPLQRFQRILAPVGCDLPLGPHVRCLSERAKLFDELRSALRLAPPSVEKRAGKVRPLETVIAAGELRDIRKEVQALASSLKARREPCAANSDTRKAINVILMHIDYVRIVCGNIDELPKTFGQLVAEDRRRRLAGDIPAPTEPHDSPCIAGASLPRADRRLVRTESMKQHLLAAAGV